MTDWLDSTAGHLLLLFVIIITAITGEYFKIPDSHDVLLLTLGTFLGTINMAWVRRG